MAYEVDSLEIKIEATSKDAAKQIDSLVASLQKLKSAVKGVGLTDTAKQLTELKNAVSGLDNRAGENIQRLATGLKALKEVTIKPTAAKGLKEIVDTVNTLKPGTGETVKNLSDGLKGFGDVKGIASVARQIEKLPDSLNALNGVDISGVTEKVRQLSEALAPLAEQMKDIGPGISTLGGGIKKATAAAAESPQGKTINSGEMTEQISLWKELGQAIKRALSPTDDESLGLGKSIAKVAGQAKSLLGSIKDSAVRVATTVLKPVKAVGSAVTGYLTKPIKNAISTYQKLSRSVGRVAFYMALRTALKIVTDGFKEGTQNIYQYSKAIGTSLAPAMDSLATSALYLKNSLGAVAAPLIEAVAPAVDMLVDKFVVLLNVIGKTFAALTGKGTYTQAIKYPKEYAEATEDASKALKSFTLGIDELNVIDTSSSGAGSAAMDYASMFEETQVDADTMDWAKAVRESIENGDWDGAGRALADKLNSLLDTVNTSAWGEKLGQKINNGLKLANSFIRNVDWQGFGVKAADFANSLFGNIDPVLLGQTLSAKLQLSIEAAYGFVTTFHWSEFGMWLGNVVNGWFSGIDWTLAGKTVSDGIIGVLDAAISFLQTVDWGQIGRDIATAISNIDFATITQKFGTLLGSALGAGIALIAGLIEKPWSDLIQWWKDVAFEDGQFTIAGLLEGIVDAVKNIGDWLKTNLVDPFVNGVKDLLGIHSPSTVFAEIGGYIVEGLLGGVKGTWGSITGFFADGFAWVTETASSTWESVKSTAGEKWESIGGTLSTAWETIKTTAGKKFEEVKTTISGTFTDTATEADTWGFDIGKNLSAGIEKAKTLVGNAVASVAQKIKDIIGFSEPDEGPLSDFHTYGPDMMQLLANGISDNSHLVTDAITEVAGSIQKAFNGIMYDPDVNYMDLINEAKAAGDWAKAAELETIRNAKIEGEGLSWEKTFDFSGLTEQFETMADDYSSQLGVMQTSATELSKVQSELITSTLKEYTESMKSAVDTNKASMNAMTANFRDMGNRSISVINSITAALNAIPRFITTVHTIITETVSGGSSKTKAYASGGFPDSGQLFIANEAGPELVANIGSKTAVANQAQIEAGIAKGVESANETQNALLREQNELLRALLAKDTSVRISNKDVKTAYDTATRQSGASIMSGGVRS